ncbi:MAG TPA: response regulator [Elusimicrobiota bacterium]|nr:response regulator [Elusimicrobiota bacterium]
MSRILIIDDDKDVVDLVRFLLEQDGHQMLEANDGIEGIRVAEQELPDLIILDVMMPEKDGYSVNTHLLSQTKTQKIPILVLTAKGQMRDLFELAPNVRFYMEKPFESKELRRNVNTALGKTN